MIVGDFEVFANTDYLLQSFDDLIFGHKFDSPPLVYIEFAMKWHHILLVSFVKFVKSVKRNFLLFTYPLFSYNTRKTIRKAFIWSNASSLPTFTNDGGERREVVNFRRTSQTVPRKYYSIFASSHSRLAMGAVPNVTESFG